MLYTMTYFCSDLNYIPSVCSPKMGLCLPFLTHVEWIFWFGNGAAVLLYLHKISISFYFPSNSFELSLLTSGRSQYRRVFFLSPGPGGTCSSLPLHHLIIIHLGGRISTAWDIRPITQSWQSTSPSPPVLLLLSRHGPIYCKRLSFTQVARQRWSSVSFTEFHITKSCCKYFRHSCLN